MGHTNVQRSHSSSHWLTLFGLKSHTDFRKKYMVSGKTCRRMGPWEENIVTLLQSAIIINNSTIGQCCNTTQPPRTCGDRTNMNHCTDSHDVSYDRTKQCICTWKQRRSRKRRRNKEFEKERETGDWGEDGGKRRRVKNGEMSYRKPRRRTRRWKMERERTKGKS